jgi:hypothetical protein
MCFMKVIVYFILVLILLQSCKNKETRKYFDWKNQKIEVVLKELSDNSYLFNINTSFDISNFINLNGMIDEIELADIDQDGNFDIIFGISKKVHFDPIVKKRIQIYTYRNGHLQPMWLGTKFVNDVKKFTIEQISKSNYLSTIEIDRNGHCIHRIYRWDNFGFTLTKTYNNEN